MQHPFSGRIDGNRRVVLVDNDRVHNVKKRNNAINAKMFSRPGYLGRGFVH
jgi:hypothetical protein